MKWLKIFSVSACIIFASVKGYQSLIDYLVTSEIEFNHSDLVKVEGNILYIENAFVGNNNQTPYKGYGMLKSGRTLADEELNCMKGEGFFYAKYENDRFDIVCKTNKGDVFYIK